MPNVDDIIRKLDPALRKKVEARASELIAEEMALRQLRAGQCPMAQSPGNCPKPHFRFFFVVHWCQLRALESSLGCSSFLSHLNPPTPSASTTSPH